MPPSPSRRALAAGLVGGLAAAGLALSALPRVAEACGMAFTRRVAGADTLPAIAVEKVLILHDPAAGQEHFIREVRFDRATTGFGFVVPTPARPEVAAVEKSPFPALENALPFPVPAAQGFGSGHGRLGGSHGGDALRKVEAVEVLSVQRVGKLEATVLAATDAAALSAWLGQHGFVATAGLTEWAAHYVRLGFTFTAFRYDDPPDGGGGGLLAQTVRLTFATPVPFYPYREPPDATVRRERLLELWVVSTERTVPVAGELTAGTLAFVQPWRAGQAYTPRREALATMLGADVAAHLPPGATLAVQTFRDWKTNRGGFGDVLLVPEASRTLSEAERVARRPLLGLLDPSLEGTP